MEIVVDIDAAQSRLEQLRRTASNVSSPRKRSADIRSVSRHPEVYEPCEDSFALVDALLGDRAHLRELKPTICVEVGCGSGYVITSLALMLGDEADVQFIATDKSKAATEATLETLKNHGVRADVVLTDLLNGLDRRVAGSVDVLVFNPPYVPTPEEEVGANGITGTWAGGKKGRVIIDRMLQVVDNVLSAKGWFYLVTVTENDPQQICRLMKKKGFGSRIVIQRHTEEENLHVLKFWREENIDDSSEFGSPTALSMHQKMSRFAFWR